MQSSSISRPTVCRSRAQNYICGKRAVPYLYSLYTVFHSVIFNSVATSLNDKTLLAILLSFMNFPHLKLFINTFYVQYRKFTCFELSKSAEMFKFFNWRWIRILKRSFSDWVKKRSRSLELGQIII